MLKKIALAGIVISFICSAAIGAEEPKNTFPGISFEVMEDELILDEKGDDYLMFCKRKLDITSYTIIKDERGWIIPFEDIEVPCEALVNYYKKPGKKRHYVVLSIEIKGEPQPTPE